ncbi:MAG: deoxyribodipyrimidine photo-lyase [Rhodoluna sp.]
MARIFWFRRDRRLSDNLALNGCAELAIKDGDKTVIPMFWYNEKDYEALSGIRQHSLTQSLKALDESMQQSLHVIRAPEMSGVVEFALKNKVKFIHATESFDPEGIAEQRSLASKLKGTGVDLVLQDSYYAVKPGTVLKPTDGTAYRVYTPFFKDWFQIGLPAPAILSKGFVWATRKEKSEIPQPNKVSPIKVRAGEQFALETFKRFKKRSLYDYSENRNRADLSGTSNLSHALAHGEIHPRTLLAELSDVDGHNVFRKEIAWREFYADVLYRNPHTVDDYYEPRFKAMRYDKGKDAKAKLDLWKVGKTGFPMVDAGMRQLLATGWMHNRVRMIVASFLVKDLHLEWQEGAKWFEENLSDFDPASNSHGWQWTAGCGTDASPYYRVFNPILQGYKFDPHGDYVRKYIPELAHIPGNEVHEPWTLVDGLVNGYPEPMLDHATERDESLARLKEIKVQ